MKSFMLKSPAIAPERTDFSFRKTKAKASRAANKKAARPAHNSRQPISVFNTLVPGKLAVNQLLQQTCGRTVEIPQRPAHMHAHNKNRKSLVQLNCVFKKMIKSLGTLCSCHPQLLLKYNIQLEIFNTCPASF